MNTIVIPELDCTAIPSSPVRLGVSVDIGVVGFEAASPPDVAADAVHVKAKKIETINVAIIVFFMLENLLFAPIDIAPFFTHLANFKINIQILSNPMDKFRIYTIIVGRGCA